MTVNEEKILSLLGFASRMRKIIFGKDRIRSYIRNRRIKYKVILIANDTGKSVLEDTIKRCESNKVKYYIFQNVDKIKLAKSVGKEEISILGIADENIAKGILNYIGEGGEDNA